MELIATKDNNYTVKIANTLLHSKYSPVKEAERFIKNSIKGENGTVVIVGGGLGYLFPIIEKNYPNLNVVAIPLHYELLSLKECKTPKNGVYLDSIKNLDSFLLRYITEKTIKGLQILEWNPSTKSAVDNHEKVNKALLKRVRRVNGNLLTTARFGKLWIKNAIKNYLTVGSYITDFTIDRPLAIIASGSSLNRSINILNRIRDKVTLIALSSSLKALKEVNIKPDLVFSTDPGYYSKLHLYGYNGPLAMPLSNSTSTNCPVLLLNNSNIFEKEILSLESIPSINIPENGTVAGTALTFALSYSKKEVYLFGQDLYSNDIKSHVTPYSFDNLLKKDETRLNSYYNIMYSRWIQSGVTYNTYRDWYSSIKDRNRILRVAPFGPPIPGIKDISLDEMINRVKKIEGKDFKYSTSIFPNKTKKIEDILTLLNSWLESFNKKIELKELIYLISPGKSTDESIRESVGFIKELLKLYGRKLL